MTDRVAQTLPPDVFESIVNALAATLIRDYRERWGHPQTQSSPVQPQPSAPVFPTWLKIAEAAKRAQCGEATIRREVRAGRLRAVKVGGRRSLRFRAEWVDEWLQGGARQN